MFHMNQNLKIALAVEPVDRMYSISEKPITYRDRPAGSESKLNTLQDGWRILRAIVWIFKDSKPFIFFLVLATILSLFASGTVVTAFITKTNLYQFVFSGIAATLFIIAAIISGCDLVLDTAVKHAREQYELGILNQKP